VDQDARALSGGDVDNVVSFVLIRRAMGFSSALAVCMEWAT
jgi:hypothetical protein